MTTNNYTVAGVALRDYGIIEGCANGSGIAVTGIYDLSARTGKCFHVWGDDNGVEPYFDADDIVLGPRKITLVGTLWENSFLSAKAKLKSLSEQLYSMDEIELQCKYGTYALFFEEVAVSEWSGGKGMVTMTFQEPAPDFTGGVLPALSAGDGIDGRSWVSLGLKNVQIKGAYGIQGKKEIKTSVPKFGGVKQSEMTLEANVYGSDCNDFEQKIKALYSLFTQSNGRVIQYNGVTIKAFAVDGFTVTDVWDFGETMKGKLTLKMIVL